MLAFKSIQTLAKCFYGRYYTDVFLYCLQVMIRCIRIGFKIFVQVLGYSWDQGASMENIIDVRNDFVVEISHYKERSTLVSI